jgi:hypothetical protein
VRNTASYGGSVLVRRRIQTPSVAKVRSAVQLEGEVVLGASPPARRFSPANPALAAPQDRGLTRNGLLTNVDVRLAFISAAMRTPWTYQPGASVLLRNFALAVQ